MLHLVFKNAIFVLPFGVGFRTISFVGIFPANNLMWHCSKQAATHTLSRGFFFVVPIVAVRSRERILLRSEGIAE